MPAIRRSALAAGVVLLRGINVGGRNRLAMRDLADVLTDLGCRDVRTYIQSGNAVLRAPRQALDRLPARLSAALAERCGLTVPVVLRAASDFDRLIADNPFLAAGADPATLHVALLPAPPSAERVAALDPQRSPGDAFAVRGCEVYLSLPGGVARTRLTNAWLDRALDTVCTVRNWRTLLALSRMVHEL